LTGAPDPLPNPLTASAFLLTPLLISGIITVNESGVAEISNLPESQLPGCKLKQAKACYLKVFRDALKRARTIRLERKGGERLGY
jgi:hypothetical protein